jgi:hypothetical protein
MVAFGHPGVYVREVPSGQISIEQASTSTAAIIGFARRGPKGEPVFITRIGEFVTRFGRLNDSTSGVYPDVDDEPDHFGHAANAFFANGGTKAYFVRVAQDGAKATAAIAHPDPAQAANNALYLEASSEGEWANGMSATLAPVDDDEEPDFTLGFTLVIGTGSGDDFEAIESFSPVALDPNASNYVKSALESGSLLARGEVKAIAGAEGGGTTRALKSGPLSGFDPASLDGESLEVAVDGGTPVTVETIYAELDKNSAGAVRRRVFEGLARLVEMSNTDFNLNAKAPEVSEAEIGAGGETGARNELAFGGPQDFDDQEGKVDAYGRLGTTGPFFERDHIIDQSFPTGIQKATFGDADVMAKGGLDPDAFQAKLEGPAKEALASRAALLSKTRLFDSSSKMAAYTVYSGFAMMMYRPVHRRVTARTASTGARGELVAGLGAGDFEKARAYLRGEEGTKPEDARAAVQARLKATFTTKFEAHAGAVRDDYAQETARVRAANPGREQAAEKAMSGIIARVQNNLIRMRSETTGLFD